MGERKLEALHSGDGFHWVGDGFYVTQVLPGRAELAEVADPFLMMDYHPPRDYAPTDRPRGVGVHPHRGFETVTLAFDGAVAHHDSTGAGGVIHAGDVQWMTAARGILHKEYHEAEWARTGGRFHMMQLWVNLPAVHKMDDPAYQPLAAAGMAEVELSGGGTVRLIAGEVNDVRGPARTFTPIELGDVTLLPGERAELATTDGHTTMVFVLDGTLEAAGSTIDTQRLGVFSRDGDALVVTAGDGGARFILLGGEPIGEPIVFHGPFAMNTAAEIRQAVTDLQAGAFGHLD